MQPPTLSARQLLSPAPSDLHHVLSAIQRAFSPGASGILLVNELYPAFEHDRLKLFQGARALANLPPQQLALLEFPQLQYAFGWSRAREKFRGVLDESKGSFYANPVYDHPTQHGLHFDPEYINHWPQHPSCHNVEPYFKAIGRYINHIAIQVAHHCDRYLRTKLPDHHHHQLCSLEQLLRDSKTAKGRLLNYFPCKPKSSSSPHTQPNLWCGYHNDHGLITGLVSAAYYEHDAHTPMPHPPDQTAGLYVLSESTNHSQRISFPADHLAFQIGETAQILSAGLLRATPHAVKMPAHMNHISRVSFALFLQPNPHSKLALPALPPQFSHHALRTHQCIPSLDARYRTECTFGEFAATTFRAYCD